jgi:hypothetical protein
MEMMMSMNPRNIKTGKCSHCGSSEIRYYGLTASTMHYYYQCGACQKFTEFHITSKKLIILEVLPLIFFAAMITSLSIIINTPYLALLILLCSIILVVISYKYRWSFGEVIALDNLPNRLIVRAVPHNIRIIIIAIFLAALLGYMGLIVFNIIRQ